MATLMILDIYTGHIDSTISVAKQIAGALAHAHAAKVVHRDVKPGNILFPEVGHKVWVADFGLSLDDTAERNTIDGEVVGPRFLTAPELEEGGGSMSRRRPISIRWASSFSTC
jgi:serine/threonine protein kinase